MIDAYSTIDELGRALRAKEVSSVELTRFYLDRLERFGGQLGAVVTITRERALREAAAADKELGAGNTQNRPLLGIPYGVKDLLATKGIPTTWGAEPYRNQVFDYDATVVEKLTSAGAVLVAKLSMVTVIWRLPRGVTSKGSSDPASSCSMRRKARERFVVKA